MTRTKIGSKHLGNFVAKEFHVCWKIKIWGLYFVWPLISLIFLLINVYCILQKDKATADGSEGGVGSPFKFCTRSTSLEDAHFALPDSASVFKSTRMSSAGFSWWSPFSVFSKEVWVSRSVSFRIWKAPFWRVVVLVFYRSLTNHHKHNGLKQHWFIISLFLWVRRLSTSSLLRVTGGW